MQGLLLVGRYRLADSIGSGGMGRVWRAHDELLHRTVAIKELTAALHVSERDAAILLARTRAEARAAARINHSAVVTVHDVLEHDGRPWIVMELVEGRSLADAVTEDGRVEPAEAARIGLWVLRALRAAHAAGVLHRDVKPGNVLLSRDGRVLLTDFGIAQIDGDTTNTRTGEVVGSVDYLAPERVRGHDPGPSSDLWALGATLYTAVEGRSPFRRTSPLTTLQAVVEEEPEPPRNAGPLGPVITAMLRKDPATRPGPDELERLLSEAAEGRAPHTAATAYVPTRYGGGTAAYTSHVPYPHEATTPVAEAPPRRHRRLRTLALVAALAALVGCGTAVGLLKWDEGRRSESTGRTKDRATASASASPSPTATATEDTGGQGGVPASWVPVEDPLGFGLSLPEGWEREPHQGDGDLKQVDYSPDDGEHFLRVSLDTASDYADPYLHQIDMEKDLQRLVNYERVTLERNVYRDRDGSEWECTWTALAKDTPFPGPRRAIEEAYVAHDGTEYVIYLSSPADDWATTAEQFASILKSWREPGASRAS